MKYAVFVKHEAGYGIKYLDADSPEEARAAVQQAIDCGEVHRRESRLTILFGARTFEVAGVLPYASEIETWTNPKQVEDALRAVGQMEGD